MNKVFQVNQTSGVIYRQGKPTLLKSIHSNNEMIANIEAMQNDQDLLRFYREHQHALQSPPIGVIGPKQATQEQCTIAERLGSAFAKLGMTIICGGREGVMEAVCKGASHERGRSIGILPGDNWQQANPYVTLPIVTAMGPMRNSIIANSAFALVAVGGGYGTLTEMAYGRHYGKKVFAIAGAPLVDEVEYFTDLNDIVHQVTQLFLGA